MEIVSVAEIQAFDFRRNRKCRIANLSRLEAGWVRILERLLSVLHKFDTNRQLHCVPVVCRRIGILILFGVGPEQSCSVPKSNLDCSQPADWCVRRNLWRRLNVPDLNCSGLAFRTAISNNRCGAFNILPGCCFGLGIHWFWQLDA